MSEVIVERALDYYGDAGTEVGFVRLFSPEQDQIDWRCRYEIEWPGYSRRGRVVGIDRWQALYLAMQRAPVEIGITDDCKNGRIGIWGEPIRDCDHACAIFGVTPVGAKQ